MHRPPRSTRTDTPFPNTAHFRSAGDVIKADRRAVVAGALLAPTVLAHCRVVVAEQLEMTTFVAEHVQTCAGQVDDDQMLVTGGQTQHQNGRASCRERGGKYV